MDEGRLTSISAARRPTRAGTATPGSDPRMAGAYVLLTEEVRRARKRYRCVHRAERIEPGDEHVYTSGAYDGSIQGDRWHRQCRDACCDEFDPEGWECWEPGGLPAGDDRNDLVRKRWQVWWCC